MSALVHVFVLTCASMVVLAYVCRLGLLSLARHKTSIVLLHIAGCGAAFGAGVNAWEGRTDLQDILSLALSGLWIGVSVWSWHGRVPDHWRR